MDSVEQLALLRTGIAVSISSMETTTDVLEKNMGEQWPEQLDRAAKEHGWSEKNLKKHYLWGAERAVDPRLGQDSPG